MADVARAAGLLERQVGAQAGDQVERLGELRLVQIAAQQHVERRRGQSAAVGDGFEAELPIDADGAALAAAVAVGDGGAFFVNIAAHPFRRTPVVLEAAPVACFGRPLVIAPRLPALPLAGAVVP
jgi:hypothetical protein